MYRTTPLVLWMIFLSACKDATALLLAQEKPIDFGTTAKPATSNKLNSTELSARFGRRLAPEGFLPDKDLPDNSYFSELRELILKNCGPTCEMTASGGTGSFFDTVEKHNTCEALFSENMSILDGLTNRWPPPQTIPEAMLDDFLMGNESLVVRAQYIEENSGALPQVWAPEYISNFTNKYTMGDYAVGYGSNDTMMIVGLIDKYKEELQNKHCAVLGSQSPWLEALLLHAGVGNVTTIEYATINSTHPQLKTMNPSDWAHWYQATQPSDYFDCVFSYSSLEHAGLGRYGDIVNPWGDLIAMGKLSCSTKIGGLIFIGYPTGVDMISWNAHRHYGPQRWAQMLANTEQLDYVAPPGIVASQGMAVARKSM